MEKRTRIIIIVAVLVGIGVVIALALGLQGSGNPSIIELEVWPNDDSSKQPLIQVRTNDAAGRSDYKQRLDKLFKEYREYTPGSQRVACSHDSIVDHQGQRVCDVPLDSFDVCSGGDNICVFLALKKVLNWTPAPYNSSAESLPRNMPEDLQNQIKIAARDGPEVNTVWVSCEGENPADVEYMGPIHYFPRRGFPSYYFPYTDQKGYLRPMVAVMFIKPSTSVLINVVCTAWARNIKNDEEEQEGVAHFSLLVD